jgi:hypothetical protein
MAISPKMAKTISGSESATLMQTTLDLQYSIQYKLKKVVSFLLPLLTAK